MDRNTFIAKADSIGGTPAIRKEAGKMWDRANKKAKSKKK